MRALARWVLERELQRQGHDGGHLYYTSQDGSLHDLGQVDPAEVESWLWASQVAYRLSRDRAERQKLSGIRARLEKLASLIK